MKKIVILTGAGMSVESGLGTFRGGGGLWDEYPVELVATPEGYAANPRLVLVFYNKRRRELLTVEPNDGHKPGNCITEPSPVQKLVFKVIC